MSKKKEEVLLKDTIPERLVKWEKDSEGKLAVLLVPKFRKGLLKKWLQPRLKKRPNFKIKLDDIGTFVWVHCNGKRTVAEISMDLEAQFGDRVKPVEDRIKLFFNSLYKSGFIRYWTSVQN